MLSEALKYEEKRFKRRDIFAALVLTLLFHALLLFLFKSPSEVVKRSGYELPSVGVVNLSDESDPEARELLDYIRVHDPSLFVLGGEAAGYSYINRQSEFRSALPASRPELGMEPERAVLADAVAIKLARRPEERVEFGLLPVLLANSGVEGEAGGVYPEITLSGGVSLSGRYDFTGYRSNIDNLKVSTSRYLLEFSGGDTLPRVEVLASSGDVLLDNALLSRLLLDIELRKHDGVVLVNVRWKEG